MKEVEEIERQIFSPAQEREWIKQTNLTYGGLIGMGFIMVQPFLDNQPLDTAAMVCVLSFALSIPLLAGLLLVNYQEDFLKRFTPSILVTIGKTVAQTTAVIGFIAGLWHIAPLAGQMAAASCIVAMIIHSAGYTKLYTLKRNRKTKGE